jgi:adenine/guanine/hypoxanthine permease
MRSISAGALIAAGLLSYTFIKLGTGRRREIRPLIWVLAVPFVFRYAFLGRE